MVEKIKQALERAYLERAHPETSISELLTNTKFHNVDPKQLLGNRIVTFEGGDSNSESYSLLAAQLRSISEADGFISLGVVSPNAAEGKSLTALNLAITLAKTTEQRVILIDGDLIYPSIHRLLNMRPEHGLIDLLNEDVELEDAIFGTNIQNLWVIPGRFEADQPLEQIRSSHLEPLLNRLSDGKRNVLIVDLPPILEKDDTIAMTACLDATILVVEYGKTKADEVSRSVALLKQTNLIGCVLNKIDRSK